MLEKVKDTYLAAKCQSQNMWSKIKSLSARNSQHVRDISYMKMDQVLKSTYGKLTLGAISATLTGTEMLLDKYLPDDVKRESNEEENLIWNSQPTEPNLEFHSISEAKMGTDSMAEVIRSFQSEYDVCQIKEQNKPAQEATEILEEAKQFNISERQTLYNSCSTFHNSDMNHCISDKVQTAKSNLNDTKADGNEVEITGTSSVPRLTCDCNELDNLIMDNVANKPGLTNANAEETTDNYAGTCISETAETIKQPKTISTCSVNSNKVIDHNYDDEAKRATSEISVCEISQMTFSYDADIKNSIGYNKHGAIRKTDITVTSETPIAITRDCSKQFKLVTDAESIEILNVSKTDTKDQALYDSNRSSDVRMDLHTRKNVVNKKTSADVNSNAGNCTFPDMQSTSNNMNLVAGSQDIHATSKNMTIENTLPAVILVVAFILYATFQFQNLI